MLPGINSLPTTLAAPFVDHFLSQDWFLTYILSSIRFSWAEFRGVSPRRTSFTKKGSSERNRIYGGLSGERTSYKGLIRGLEGQTSIQ